MLLMRIGRIRMKEAAHDTSHVKKRGIFFKSENLFFLILPVEE